MSDDRWRDSYDAWKLATPPEYEGPEDEPESELDAADRRIAELREERDQLRRLYDRAIAENNAAVAWVREYERRHGQLDPEPRVPDFMIVF